MLSKVTGGFSLDTARGGVAIQNRLEGIGTARLTVKERLV